MQNIIQVKIFKGEQQYVAQGIDIPVVTQGKTFDELIANLTEAIDLQLEGEDMTVYNLSSSPSVLMNYELPTRVHA